MTERTRRRELACMAMGLVLATLVMHLAKDVSGRARPEVFLAGNPMWQFLGGFRTSGYASFPSGHAMSAFALSGALSAMYPKGRPVFFVAAAVCGLTRILDNQHYLSDVVAGGVLGWWIGSGALRWRWTARIAERLCPARTAQHRRRGGDDYQETRGGGREGLQGLEASRP
jgi:undecaprenyl-diphosphatase